MSHESQPVEREQSREQPDPEIRCRQCGHPITRADRAIEVLGKHEHTFRNPAGYSFHVACYSQTPGCLVVGEPTSGATWFPGYRWCFSLCIGCQTHLGWWYQGPTFFSGLIVPRLVRSSSAG